MTPLRKFDPQIRLKRLIAEPGGVTAEQAVSRAETNLSEIRDACLEAVDDKIQQIGDLARTGGDEALDACYTLANQVFAEAGAFGLNELSSAAHSLCSLLAVADRARVPAAAIRVHIDAMRALRSPEAAQDSQVRTTVLAELKALTARLAL